MSAREYVLAGEPIGSTPTRHRVEDDRADGCGLVTISFEALTSAKKTAQITRVLAALDLTTDEVLWLRDTLSAVLEEELPW